MEINTVSLSLKSNNENYTIGKIKTDDISLSTLFNYAKGFGLFTDNSNIEDEFRAGVMLPNMLNMFMLENEVDIVYMIESFKLDKINEICIHVCNKDTITHDIALEIDCVEDDLVDEEQTENDNMEGYESNDDSECGESTGDIKNTVSKMASSLKQQQWKFEEDGSIQFRVGDVFDDVYHFRSILKDFSIQDGFNIKRTKNDRDRIIALCATLECPWRVHASECSDKISFVVRKYVKEHICLRQHELKEGNSVWISQKLSSLIRANPEISNEAIEEELRSRYGFTTKRQTLYRVKRRALDLLAEDFKHSYEKAHTYGKMLKCRNPDTMALVMSHRYGPEYPPVFKRFFLSFGAQKQWFIRGCRPFIGLDGCFLKGPYGGVLLSAIALDANSGKFPVAVCEAENSNSWGWFLTLLHEHIGVECDKLITFMSDRQKGRVESLARTWPNSNTRFCAKHIFQNFKNKFPQVQFRKQFWAASRATNKVDFDYWMESMKSKDPMAHKYLFDITSSSWSRHGFDQQCKSEHMTNNLTESFNGWIGYCRDKPFFTMMEYLRKKLMKRMRQRINDAHNLEGDILPVVQKQIDMNRHLGRHMSVVWGRGFDFEVAEGTKTFEVFLENHYCQCGSWQVSGVPCMHALAANNIARIPLTELLDYFHKKEAHLLTYSEMIGTLPDQATLKQTDCEKLLPPERLRKPGRPPKNRKRDATEPPKKATKRYSQRCSFCDLLGHNSRGCPKKK